MYFLFLHPASPPLEYRLHEARKLSGRMPDSQCSEPGFVFPFAILSNIEHLFLSSLTPQLTQLSIGVNRPAFGGTVPHFHQMSRGAAKSADVPHFSKIVLLFFSLPIILHVCLATQQSDELRIKIGKDRFKIRMPTGH